MGMSSFRRKTLTRTRWFRLTDNKCSTTAKREPSKPPSVFGIDTTQIDQLFKLADPRHHAAPAATIPE